MRCRAQHAKRDLREQRAESDLRELREIPLGTAHSASDCRPGASDARARHAHSGNDGPQACILCAELPIDALQGVRDGALEHVADRVGRTL
jgi:hypothetical protein